MSVDETTTSAPARGRTEPSHDPGLGREFEGLTVLVTGGGTGIGEQTAREFAQRGARVLVVGRRAEAVNRTAESHPRIEAATGDMCSATDVDRVITRMVSLWNRVDIVVNNAGGFAAGPLDSMTDEAVDDLVAINVKAPTMIARAALPHLDVHGGCIVNVTSTYAQKAAARSAHYAATKAALESLTRSWALELAPRGIRVNAVSPGPTESDLLVRSGIPEPMIAQIKERETQAIPAGRRGTPADVARWIVAFADPASSWVTGQVLGVDGGLSIT